MSRFSLKSFLIGLSIGLVIVASAAGGAIADRLFDIKPLDFFTNRQEVGSRVDGKLEQKVLNEESVVIEVAERVSPTVVTVSIVRPQRRILEFNPFGGFSSRIEGGQPQDIGTGFVVSTDGLIITNKHVVSDA